MTPKKILFCTDFSNNSEPARTLAVDYAKAFGAELLIVHVIDTTGIPRYADFMVPTMEGEMNRFLRRSQEACAERLGSLASECAQVVKDVKTYCRIGSAPNEIVALADEESADLLVMGTHGRTGVTHLVLGSIARSVLKKAHRPVLIVEAPAEGGESSERTYDSPAP
jgi:universal stress protein A